MPRQSCPPEDLPPPRAPPLTSRGGRGHPGLLWQLLAGRRPRLLPHPGAEHVCVYKHRVVSRSCRWPSSRTRPRPPSIFMAPIEVRVCACQPCRGVVTGTGLLHRLDLQRAAQPLAQHPPPPHCQRVERGTRRRAHQLCTRMHLPHGACHLGAQDTVRAGACIALAAAVRAALGSRLLAFIHRPRPRRPVCVAWALRSNSAQPGAASCRRGVKAKEVGGCCRLHPTPRRTHAGSHDAPARVTHTA